MEPSKEWREGENAADTNPEGAINPYNPMTQKWEDWADGFAFGLNTIINPVIDVGDEWIDGDNGDLL